MNYFINGHYFIFQMNCAYNITIFICNKCKIKGYSDLYHSRIIIDGFEYKNLTCEEVFVKNILE